MEIELDLTTLKLDWWALAAVLLLVFFGVIGYQVTPADGRVMTWSEWQVARAERQYQQELRQLQNFGAELSSFLAVHDPVRVQLQVQQMQEKVAQMSAPALERQREAFQRAANAVVDYQNGQITYNDAAQAVQEYLDAVR